MNPEIDIYAYGEFDPEYVPKTRLPPVRVDSIVGQEEDDKAVCRGCNRYWRAVRKSGYCDECEDAIREDIEDGKCDERRLPNTRIADTGGAKPEGRT